MAPINRSTSHNDSIPISFDSTSSIDDPTNLDDDDPITKSLTLIALTLIALTLIASLYKKGSITLLPPTLSVVLP